MKNPSTNPLEQLAQQQLDEEFSLHERVAEKGKVLALQNQHGLAQKYYRKAIELAIQADEPDAYLQHYTLCMLESLELSGKYDAVLQYCDHAFKTLKGQGQAHETIAVAQRKAAILLKLGKGADAADLLQKIMPQVAKSGQNLLLSQAMLEMAESGKNFSAKAIKAIQEQHHYFCVRKDTVNTDIALALPESAFD